MGPLLASFSLAGVRFQVEGESAPMAAFIAQLGCHLDNLAQGPPQTSSQVDAASLQGTGLGEYVQPVGDADGQHIIGGGLDTPQQQCCFTPKLCSVSSSVGDGGNAYCCSTPSPNGSESGLVAVKPDNPRQLSDPGLSLCSEPHQVQITNEAQGEEPINIFEFESTGPVQVEVDTVSVASTVLIGDGLLPVLGHDGGILCGRGSSRTLAATDVPLSDCIFGGLASEAPTGGPSLQHLQVEATGLGSPSQAKGDGALVPELGASGSYTIPIGSNSAHRARKLRLCVSDPLPSSPPGFLPSGTEIENSNVEQLRKLCKTAGLKAGGGKKALQDRLYECISLGGPKKQLKVHLSDESTAASETPLPVDLPASHEASTTEGSAEVRGSVQVFVKCLTKTIRLLVEPSVTLGSVKHQACDKEGIPPEQRRLLFADEPVEEEMTLAVFGGAELAASESLELSAENA